MATQTPQFIDVSRREFFRRGGFNLGAAALAALLANDFPAGDAASNSASAEEPTGATKPASASGAARRRIPHFPPRAKQIIYLHMIGAPSQLDLFDDKPRLREMDGQPCPEELTKGKRFAFIGDDLHLAGSRFKFAKHGSCGAEMSELLPHLSRVADDLCILRGLHTNEINHAPAQMFLHSGFGRGGRPSFGAWVTYGLGAESSDLPAYVVLLSGPAGGAGTSMWSTGFLPSVYQGVQFRSSGEPVLFLNNPKSTSRDERRRVLDAVRELNSLQFDEVGDPEINTRISQYEMAYR
ncbi:MAG TPA: DUF1501 domain-containing protein, partial [Pirellulaceae bacterium]|nr:DUF1501 domain-containing protein [Pirellulaceae bacterium]